jgi:hypothetical protein
MPDNPPATVRQLEIGMPGQEGGELRLNRLLHEPPRPRAQNFCQGIVNFV